ncbi:UDP-N-acetylmuramoyl-tripeptide--D-alanyl-D-alanine ligase [Betaproteobacteria bacterium]|nr:UDP-N-acetylmuramoyl-tripeptide--D-alanyl-D-alanine ligase [Betaproteobacteria bacterium]
MSTSLNCSLYKIDLETSFGEIDREFPTKCMVTNQSQYSHPRISNITTDSRSADKNSLFFALKGDKFDGHDFVKQAKINNAIGAVVDSNKVDANLGSLVDQNFCLVCVDDTSSFLLDFAQWHRDKFNPFVTSIVGSNGKTTSKEMIAHILGSVFHSSELVITRANQNNQIGVPLNLLRINERTKHVVLEIGMNTLGEIDRLAKKVKPNLVLITNAQRDHQEFLNSVSITANENGKAIKALQSSGTTVIPADSNHEEIWLNQAQSVGSDVIRFGIYGEFNNLFIKDYNYVTGKIVQDYPLIMEVQGKAWSDSLIINLQGLGKQYALNALSSFAVTDRLRIPHKKIVESLEDFLPIDGRGVIYPFRRGVFFVDDTYNANPDSMLAAIEALGKLQVTKCMVLADMGELGEKSAHSHAEVLTKASQKIEKVFLIGKEFAKASQKLRVGFHCLNDSLLVNEINNWINRQIESHPKKEVAVWFKGSRFNGLEKVVKSLLKKELN